MTQWAAEDLRNSAQCLLDYYAGNAEAFEEFIAEHMPWMRVQVRKFGRHVDVDDVTQSVAVRIFSQASHVQRCTHPQSHDSPHDHASRGADEQPASVDTHGEVKQNGWYDPSKGSVKAWLYVLLWHEAVSQLRKSKRLVSFDEKAHGGVHYDFIEEELMVRERLEGLSDRERRAIEERRAGRTYEEIAEQLHCSVATVFNYVHRLKS
jgi:DNA-directed RNA polymerase specialized sigma24 family protein